MVNHRVQKFDSEGNFLLMFGGEVNKTTNGDVCTAASEDICGAGVAGEGNGEFATGEFGDYIDVGPGGEVFVGGKGGRIQEFNASGEFQDSVLLAGEPAGETIQSLEVDSAGNFFVTLSPPFPDVYKASPSGVELAKRLVTLPTSLALDAEDNLYVVGGVRRVIAFSPGGEMLITEGEKFAEAPGGTALGGLAVNTVTAAGETAVYTATVSAPEVGKSYLSAYGPPPDLWPPPLLPPTIAAQYATAVNPTGATLKADINPRFWTNTRYYVEYGTAPCATGGCTQALPVPPGALLGGGLVNKVITSKGIAISGLAPETTYHYRFVAESSGSGGEPVRGVGGEVGADGAEASFTTPAPLTSLPDSCANSAFRGGAGSYLPDCRAYEMVSPVNKGGGDILPMINIANNPAALNQATPEGNKLTYSTYRAFGDAKSAPYSSQYVASRIEGKEWASRGVSPARGVSVTEVGGLDVEFRWFAEDLCQAQLLHETDPLLAPGAIPGYPNFFATDLCAPESYRALNPLGESITTPEEEPAGFEPDLQAVTPDGRVSVIRVADRLTFEAPVGKKENTYAFGGEGLQLVCVLPNGAPLGQDCSAGTANLRTTVSLRTASVHNALSADGTKLYWTAAGTGPGPLYLRLNPAKPQGAVSGEECLEPAMACTVKVGTGRFWSASPDGRKAIYQNGDELLRFDLDEEAKSTPIATGVLGVAGVSEDTSRVYFVSTEVLDAGASAGARNLYLSEGGGFDFIGTLSAQDARLIDGNSQIPSVIQAEPYRHGAQITADGSHIVFMSNAPLSGYDNKDAASGEPATEVYRYSAATDQLLCVSCNPTGARPNGVFEERGFWSAAQIATPQTQLYASRVVSADGSRVFFESFDALVPGDNNNARDVYQWEQASSKAECAALGGGTFAPKAGGCIALISYGEASGGAQFVDASADGSDVFFTTGASLLRQDPGQIDIYDARIDGGLPQPPEPRPGCEGDACQNPPPAPQYQPPSSSSFQGPGNPPLAKKKKPKKCAKGKRRVTRKGKSRCVAKKSKQKKKSASKSRRAGR